LQSLTRKWISGKLSHPGKTNKREAFNYTYMKCISMLLIQNTSP
jgi:hypothetical protein